MKAIKFYLSILLAYSLIFVSVRSYSQVGIKLGTGSTLGTKIPSAVLDLGTGTQGLLLPKVSLTSTTSQSPLVGATFAVAAPAGMTVYNTATAGTAPNNVTPGIYYSDGTTWIRNEEIGVINGLTKNTGLIELGGTLTKTTTINQNGFNLVLSPSSTASGITFAGGNNTANNRILMPTDGLEIQSNEILTPTKPIIQVMNSTAERFRVQSDGKVGIGIATPSSTFHTNGTIAVTTGTTTVNSVILSSTNVTLPDAITCSGRIYMIRNIGTVAISVTSIIAFNSTTAAVYSLSAAEGAITVVSNGTNWYRIQ